MSCFTSFAAPPPDIANEEFLQDVWCGLSRDVKQLPSKYFYDERGSRLFDQICDLEEYYLTRTELRIMQQYASEMAEQIGPGVMLVEYGSGSSVKTRILLDHLDDPVAYVPVDISEEHLQKTAMGLSEDYPTLEVLPVAADFTQPFALPVSERPPTHAAVYFPGSTIGNFEIAEAQRLLQQIANLCGTGGGLLIGIDLQKDPEVLEAAYDDAEGVTADFNLNLLHRINRELEGDLDVSRFRHRATYDPIEGRIEISAVSQTDQVAQIAGREFQFADGEPILTEYSHKYTIEGFTALAAEAGLSLHKSWTDELEYFAVLHLVIEE